MVLFMSAWTIWGFGFETTWTYMSLSIDGVITSSRDVPATSAPRYATEYLIRGPDGRGQRYVAGATDASLPRSLPAGTRLLKRPWTFSYERDGHVIHEFPIGAYTGILMAATLGLVWSVSHLYRQWPKARAYLFAGLIRIRDRK